MDEGKGLQQLIKMGDLGLLNKSNPNSIYNTPPISDVTPLLFIDCDAGDDDAVAVMMAMTELDSIGPKPEVLGISACYGNTNQTQVQKNILRVLRAMGKEMYIFPGADRPLIEEYSEAYYHGMDGLNTPELPPFFDPEDPDFPFLVDTEHAANAMIRITRQHPGEVTLVCLGPLTNLALALRMDSTLPQRVKRLVVMGGTKESRGNVHPTCEFNFKCDPEAVHIVLSSFQNTELVTWELCEEAFMPWPQFDKLFKGNSDQCRFLGAIFKNSYLVDKRNQALPTGPRAGAIICDALAMAVALAPTSVVTESHRRHVTVELASPLTRGHCIVDWESFFKKSSNVQVITKVDSAFYHSLLSKVFLQSIPLQF